MKSYEKILVGLLIGGLGLVLVWSYSSFNVALGVFLMIWANNIKDIEPPKEERK